jgi:hypothetical protein
MSLLDAMTAWINEAPPLGQSNQRFGNLAFRQYIAIVEDVSCANGQMAALTYSDYPT